MRLNTKRFFYLCIVLILPHNVQAGFLLEIQYWAQNIICFFSQLITRHPCSRVDQRCPTCLPLSAENFSIHKFIESTWYIQEQQLTFYQGSNQLYCSAATYQSLTYSDIIRVNNYGNVGDVNSGVIQDSNSNGLIGRVCMEQIKGGNLRVGPCTLTFAFDLFSAPYWVVAVGSANVTEGEVLRCNDHDDDDDSYSGSGSERSNSKDHHIEYEAAEGLKEDTTNRKKDEDDDYSGHDDDYSGSRSGSGSGSGDSEFVKEVYTWAIVIAGQPDVVKETEPEILCTTRNTRNFFEEITYKSGSGLWFLTRDEVACDETIAEMEAAARELGIYTGDMFHVEQEHCNYEGYFIK